MTFTKIPFEKTIELLLQKHECVILPGFGGFIVRDSPCNFNASKDQVKPFARHIFFNPHLIENDGLLLNAIQKNEGLNYSAAGDLSKQAIVDLKNEIENVGSKNFGVLGTFFKGQENIWFAPSSSLNLSLDSYGLKPVDVKTVSEDVKEVVTETKVISVKEFKPKVEELADNKEIEPVEKKKTGYAAWLIAASVALLVHFVYLQVEPKSNNDHEASIIPQISVSNDSNTELVTEEPVEYSQVDSTPFLSETKQEEEVLAPVVETLTKQKETPVQVEETKETPKVETVLETPVIETPETSNLEVPAVNERVVARYLMEANALYHAKDLIKTGIHARVEHNGTWFEVRSLENNAQ